LEVGEEEEEDEEEVVVGEAILVSSRDRMRISVASIPRGYLF
jgi:hypothetical protein